MSVLLTQIQNKNFSAPFFSTTTYNRLRSIQFLVIELVHVFQQLLIFKSLLG